MLGSTPEVYGGDHDLLLSLYPPAISASSLLEACPPIPPCCPWDVRDGTSQGIPIQADTESHCFPRDSPVGIPPHLQNKPATPHLVGKCIVPRVGRARACGTLHPFCRSNDRGRRAAAGPCRQPRWDPSAERFCPGAGYGTAGCSQPSQPGLGFAALPRLLKAAGAELAALPRQQLAGWSTYWLQPGLGNLWAWWHGQELPWLSLTPCLDGFNRPSQGHSPTIAPSSCKPSPPALRDGKSS